MEATTNNLYAQKGGSYYPASFQIIEGSSFSVWVKHVIAQATYPVIHSDVCNTLDEAIESITNFILNSKYELINELPVKQFSPTDV